MKKGPSFNIPTIEDISRILRRNLPVEGVIHEDSRTAKSQEDDEWPLDGTETPNRWKEDGINGPLPMTTGTISLLIKDAD